MNKAKKIVKSESLRDKLFEQMTLKAVDVTIGNLTVVVHELYAEELQDMRKNLLGDDPEPNMDLFNQMLVIHSVKDTEGNRIFEPEDAERLKKTSPSKFNKLANAAVKINGLSGEEGNA